MASKKIYSFLNLMLGSLIALLGFGSCKTAKKTRQPETNTMLVLYGPPPVKVENPNPQKEMKLLYGAPPVRVEKVQE